MHEKLSLVNGKYQLVAEAETFEEFIKGRTFTNPKTHNKVKFRSLSKEQQTKIRTAWKKKASETKKGTNKKPIQQNRLSRGLNKEQVHDAKKEFEEGSLPNLKFIGYPTDDKKKNKDLYVNAKDPDTGKTVEVRLMERLPEKGQDRGKGRKVTAVKLNTNWNAKNQTDVPYATYRVSAAVGSERHTERMDYLKRMASEVGDKIKKAKKAGDRSSVHRLGIILDDYKDKIKTHTKKPFSQTLKVVTADSHRKAGRIKFMNSMRMGKQMVKAEKITERDLKTKKPGDKDFAAAACFRLMSNSGLRIGTRKSMRTTGVQGAATLRKNNITFMKNGDIKIKFFSKGRKEFSVPEPVTDPVLKKALRQLYKSAPSKDDFLFRYGSKGQSIQEDDIRGNPNRPSAYMNKLGMAQVKPHNIRRVVCSRLFLNSVSDKRKPQIKMEVDKQGNPSSGYIKKVNARFFECLEPATKQLGHLKAGGKPNYATTIKAYLDPTHMANFFDAYGISQDKMPQALQKYLAVSSDGSVETSMYPMGTMMDNIQVVPDTQGFLDNCNSIDWTQIPKLSPDAAFNDFENWRVDLED